MLLRCFTAGPGGDNTALCHSQQLQAGEVAQPHLPEVKHTSHYAQMHHLWSLHHSSHTQSLSTLFGGETGVSGILNM